MTEYSPLEVTNRTLKFWPLIALVTILGGLVGLLVFSLREPLYESRIEFTFNIDYARAGVLTDVEEDQALEAAGDILGSSAVMQHALDAARLEGVSLNLAELQAATTRERAGSVWRVRVRAPQPETAALLANAWGEAAAQALSEASRHAVNVDGLSRYLDALEGCLESAAAVEPVQALCTNDRLPDIQARLEETGAAIHAEKIASRGMMPGLGFQWTEEAVPADRPVIYGRGSLVLAGALTGFVLAAAALQFGRQPGARRKPTHG